jgi:hypothetical protein
MKDELPRFGNHRRAGGPPNGTGKQRIPVLEAWYPPVRIRTPPRISRPCRIMGRWQPSAEGRPTARGRPGWASASNYDGSGTATGEVLLRWPAPSSPLSPRPQQNTASPAVTPQ